MAAADPLQTRLERNERQAAALRRYAETLPAAPAFPFERFTRGPLQGGYADVHLVYRDSAIRPFIGVVTLEQLVPDYVTSYPGVVMTRAEYNRMPVEVPTAVDVDLHVHIGDNFPDAAAWRRKRYVIVGWPNVLGTNIMCNYQHEDIAPNVKLFRLEDWGHTGVSDQDARGVCIVAPNMVHVRRIRPPATIDANTELMMPVYAPDFFDFPTPHCDHCFLKQQQRNLWTCTAAGCSLAFHPTDTCAGPDHTHDKTRFLCVYHRRGGGGDDVRIVVKKQVPDEALEDEDEVQFVQSTFGAAAAAAHTRAGPTPTHRRRARKVAMAVVPAPGDAPVEVSYQACQVLTTARWFWQIPRGAGRMVPDDTPGRPVRLKAIFVHLSNDILRRWFPSVLTDARPATRLWRLLAWAQDSMGAAITPSLVNVRAVGEQVGAHEPADGYILTFGDVVARAPLPDDSPYITTYWPTAAMAPTRSFSWTPEFAQRMQAEHEADMARRDAGRDRKKKSKTE